ncbi:diguanylate cyclase [Aquamicrobium terrae]
MDDTTVRMTLTLIGPGTLAVFGCVFAAAWAIDRKRPYLLLLAGACALFVVGACVQIVYWPRTPGANALVSCIFYTSAVLLTAEGLLKRSGRRLGLGWGLAAGAVIVGLVWYFYYVDRNLLARVYVMNFGYGLILLWATVRLRHLWRARFVDRALFVVLLAFSAQFFVRTMLTIGFEAPPLGARAFGQALFWQTLQLSMAVLGSALAVAILAVAILAAAVMDVIDDLRRERDSDRLTGVFNRRGFDERAKAIFAGEWQRPLSLVLCDIDHFKRINDTFGHGAGDAVLNLFGALLAEAAGPGNPVGRIGGEEFAILLHGQTSADAMRWVELLRAAIGEASFGEMDGKMQVTASFGIAEAMERDTLSTLTKRADARLYRAKQGGRNRAVAFEGTPIIAPLQPDDAERPHSPRAWLGRQ